MRARQSVRQDIEGPRNKLGSQTDGEQLRPAEDPWCQRVEEWRPGAPFTFSNNRTRSNGWKLELKRFNTSQCGNFFTYKIDPIWNRLPAEAVNSASVEQFKIELDKVIDTLI